MHCRYSGQPYRKETCKGGKTVIQCPRWITLGFTQVFQFGELAWAEAHQSKNEGFLSRWLVIIAEPTTTQGQPSDEDLPINDDEELSAAVLPSLALFKTILVEVWHL